MKSGFAALLTACVVVAGCGAGSSARSAIPTAPSSPPPATGGSGLTGRWIGRELSTVVTWSLTQEGSAVSGPSSFSEPGAGGAGTVTGTVSDSTFTFKDNYPSLTDGASRNCTAVITGTLTIGGASMGGPYQGTNSCTGPFEGRINFTKQ